MLYLECDDPLDAGQAALSAFVSSSPIRRGIRSKKFTKNVHQVMRLCVSGLFISNHVDTMHHAGEWFG